MQQVLKKETGVWGYRDFSGITPESISKHKIRVDSKSYNIEPIHKKKSKFNLPYASLFRSVPGRIRIRFGVIIIHKILLHSIWFCNEISDIWGDIDSSLICTLMVVIGRVVIRDRLLSISQGMRIEKVPIHVRFMSFRRSILF